jgi:hypothetical protein
MCKLSSIDCHALWLLQSNPAAPYTRFLLSSQAGVCWGWNIMMLVSEHKLLHSQLAGCYARR